MAPKRSRISESESLEGVDDHKQLSQNSTLPAAPQPQDKQIMSLGLPTSDPTKRSSPPPFGKFLEACRWCKKKLIKDIYMYGYVSLSCFFFFFLYYIFVSQLELEWAKKAHNKPTN